MRAKKAKRLRSLARALTAGAPDRRLMGRRNGEFGRIRVFNDPRSTRAIYRGLKKGALSEAKMRGVLEELRAERERAAQAA